MHLAMVVVDGCQPGIQAARPSVFRDCRRDACIRLATIPYLELLLASRFHLTQMLGDQMVLLDPS